MTVESGAPRILVVDDEPNIVETYISYLRKKIDDREPALIHTIRRVGYTLRMPREK